MYKYIIFDFNGTLLDDVIISLDALNFCYNKYIDKNNKISLKDYLDKFSFPVGKYYESLGFDFNKINYDLVANDFIDYYTSRFKENKLYPEVKDVLNKLKKENYKLIILTASYIKLIEKQLKYYQIEDYFDYLLAQKNKYAESKVKMALDFFKEKNINPNQCLYIGDTLHDIEVAKEIGVKIISFSKGHNSKELLETKNNDVIDNLMDIFKYLK